MNYSVFPNVKKQQIEANAEQRKSIVDSKYNEEISELNHITDNINSRLAASIKKPSSIGDYVVGFGFAGVALSFLVCCVGCCQDDLNGIEDAYAFTGIALAIGGWILGGIVGKISHSSYEKDKQNKEESTRNRNQDTASKISALERERSEKKSEIDREANLEYTRYLRGFESEAKTESVRFAESELAVRVINWISEGYIRTIESTDRRSHIERIIVPFIFNVYRDKITCNLGEFNFEIERCRNLDNPLEQAALARAIAASIQVNITMKFPQDPSGTNIKIDVSHDYLTDHVSTTMNYTAPNGNYQAVKGW